MKRLFGTDGIRGIPGQFPLDGETLYRVGAALVGQGKRRILVGRDTRASGGWIERVLYRAIQTSGGEATCAGVITTPGLARLVSQLQFDAGIMISASHNPYQDNGVKILSAQGTKLSDQEEDLLAASLSRIEPVADLPPFQEIPEVATRFDEDLISIYAGWLADSISHPLKGLRVVLDCAEGAAFHIAPQVFSRLGAEVKAIHVHPDGHNINANCGSLHPEEVARLVVESKADLGVAFDGDSDRAILVDQDGVVRDGDFVLYLLGVDLLDSGRLPTRAVVTTVMANMGLEVALSRLGISTIRTKVGDRYVLEEMLKSGHVLGGEQSGHIILRERSLSGDGILTALAVAEVMVREGKTLSDLCRGMEKFPQVLVNVQVREKIPFREIPELNRQVEVVSQELGEEGRLLIRYSGTEPLLRIMVEGKSHSRIQELARDLAGSFEKKLGLTGTAE